MCGKNLPSFPHLVWKCQATQKHRQGLRLPNDTAEERLLASTIGPPPTPWRPTDETPTNEPTFINDVATYITTSWLSDDYATIAVDGGAKNGCSSYAIAIGSDTYAGPIAGEDYTPCSAELEAICRAVGAAAGAVEQEARTQGQEQEQARERCAPGPRRYIDILADCKPAITIATRPTPLLTASYSIASSLRLSRSAKKRMLG